jgi:IS30 family transposase
LFRTDKISILAFVLKKLQNETFNRETKVRNFCLTQKRHFLKRDSQRGWVHKSVISRELRRNAGKRGGYHADQAQALADERKERFKRARRFTPGIEKLCRNYIEEEQWSPEEIVGYCKANGIEMVSIERIYQFIRADKRNGGTLFTHLRHRLKHRKRAVSRRIR